MTTLHATRGANFWSRRPVTRMDLAVGAYEDISSADVKGFTEALVDAMPGLRDHRCSIGEPGGFIMRLRDGTYAPHIVEHVALELQTMIGHDVGFGKTRGGGVPGEYTLVFEHLHEQVGLRSAALALEVVQRAFVGTLDGVGYATAELASLAETSKIPDLKQRICCGITGGSGRAETRAEMLRQGFDCNELIVEVAPSYLLQAGLPYSRSEMAVIVDANIVDVPSRYAERDRAAQLLSVVADGVQRNGVVVVPAKEWEIQEMVRDADCRLAIFSTRNNITRRDKKLARTSVWVDGRRIVIEHLGDRIEGGWLQDDINETAQIAAATAVFSLKQLQPAATGREA
ncbi:MAG: hypothetical protein H0U64_02400 [Gemmatimonadaceae bacterium]|nr:hypothetical protein [Gemmatimonadaceae bacterium]